MGANGMFDKIPNGEWLLIKKTFSAVDTVEGVKVLRMDGTDKGKLPLFAQRSTAYIGITHEGKLTQMRIFKNHLPIIDIDLAHAHHHKVGEIHVHDFDVSNPQRPIRSMKGRPLSDEEKKLYGDILKAMKGYKK